MNRVPFRPLILSIFTLTASISVAAQNQSRLPGDGRPSSLNRVQADESFELNIKERRIVERNFEASTSVSTSAEQSDKVRVQIGVALTAGSIDVFLRNVTGSVRFRGSLERIVDLLSSRSHR